MAEIRETEFRKAIEKELLSGAYLLYGEEKYTMLQSVRKLVQKAESTGFADFNLQRFDGTEVKSETIAAAAEALPFFAEKKYITISDFNPDTMPAGELESYLELLRDLPESTILILYLPSVELGKRPSAKWKQVLSVKSLTLVEFRRKTDSELDKYLMAFAEKRGCTLSKDLAKRMYGLCGKDLEVLSREMAKLCGFVGSGEITKAKMDQIVTKNQEAQIFALSKAMIEGQYEKAYATIDGLLQQGEEPVAIVAMLSSAYLNLYRAKCMVQSGQPVSALSQSFDYKNREFLLRSAEQDCSRFSMQTIEKSLDYLLEADFQLKGGAGSGRGVMQRVVLDELIAKLLLAAQEN